VSAARRPVALITGAGSGIGRAAARMFHERNFMLVLVGRTAEKLAETSRAIGAEDALVVTGDIADREFPHACIDRSVERFGRLDVLVNNAGVAPLATIPHTDEATLDACFRVNTFGPALLIARAWPTFVRQRSGCVVNVSTIGTSDPFAGFFAYAASKSALDSFTRSIAREGRSAGITAYSVNPGAVETPLLRQNFDEAMLPRSKTIPADDVARIIVGCACGERPEDNGRTILLPSGR